MLASIGHLSVLGNFPKHSFVPVIPLLVYTITASFSESTEPLTGTSRTVSARMHHSTRETADQAVLLLRPEAKSQDTWVVRITPSTKRFVFLTAGKS